MLVSKKLTTFLTLFFLTLTLSFSSALKADEAGIALTFDDESVEQWYTYFSNQSSDVRATFFVNNWHTLTSTQIEMLRSLKNMGHEIASHTYDHSGVFDVYQDDPNRVDEYIKEQIIPSLNNMKKDGFNPVSFAYPYSQHSEPYDNAVRAYFPYIRGGFTDKSLSLFEQDQNFHNAPKNYNYLEADGIDRIDAISITEIEKALDRAKNNNEILTVLAHRIHDTHQLGISTSKLDQVINAVKARGLKFYTHKDAYQVGNKGNTTIQVLAGNQIQIEWDHIDSDFIGIVPEYKNNWSQGMPKTEFAVNNSGNVTIPVSNPLNQQKYRAIFYKAGVKRFISEPFFIINNNAPLNEPVVLSPIGDTNRKANGKVNFSWNTVSGASSYDITSYATHANGEIDYSTILLDINISAESAKCLYGGVCQSDAVIAANITTGVWKIRANSLLTDGNYGSKIFFTLAQGNSRPDTTPPVITLNGSNPTTVSINSHYLDDGAIATDNIDGAVNVSTNSSNVNTSVVGTYSVIFTAVDSSGNTATTQRTVQVIDSSVLVPPTIISPKGNTAVSTGNVTFSWNAVPGATSYDYISFGLTPAGKIDYSKVFFDKRVSSSTANCNTANICTVIETIPEASAVWKIRANTDTNKSEYTQKILFTLTGGSGGTDTNPPVITLKGSNPVSVAIHSSYVDAGATATDDIDGSVSVTTDSSNLNTAVVGTYTVTFTAIDSAGNTSTKQRIVHVIDNSPVLLPPTIISPKGDTAVSTGNVTFSWNSVSGATSYDYIAFGLNTAGKADYSKVLFNKRVSSSAANCTTSSICSVTETISVSSAAWKVRANTATEKSDYTLKTFFTLTGDTIPPTITLNGSNPVTVEINSNYVDAGATATDNVDGSVIVTVDSSNLNTSVVGTYTIIYTAVDSTGNTATKQRTVYVVNNTTALTIPTIISPQDTSNSPAGSVTFSWYAVPGATSYGYLIYGQTPTGRPDYSNVLFDDRISAVDANCSTSNICHFTANISASSAVWKVRANTDSEKSDYTEKTFFSLNNNP